MAVALPGPVRPTVGVVSKTGNVRSSASDVYRIWRIVRGRADEGSWLTSRLSTFRCVPRSPLRNLLRSPSARLDGHLGCTA